VHDSSTNYLNKPVLFSELQNYQRTLIPEWITLIACKLF